MTEASISSLYSYSSFVLDKEPIRENENEDEHEHEDDYGKENT